QVRKDSMVFMGNGVELVCYLLFIPYCPFLWLVSLPRFVQSPINYKVSGSTPKQAIAYLLCLSAFFFQSRDRIDLEHN
ncbi:MAG: hypothetical protein AB4290_16330, partial [Spirulina sp.]